MTAAQQTPAPTAESAAQPAQGPAPAKGVTESREGFYDIEQLERLFRVAREAGFSEEELKQITIEDEQGRTVNAWDYLEEVKRRRTVKDRSAQERLQKIYLTVQDVLADLRRREKEDLKELRDKSVFKE
jgi:DNA-binding transcriptional MerR regulator